ncbi:MAG: hypothetical protein C0522_00010 [Rhodocyclaceae bacterium]|jgi:type IV pilus assembly protein PilX|nr:hypothetical protein [Rhodocyclaceae bacterium]
MIAVTPSCSRLAGQRGVALPVALMVLVAMLLAAATLIRSVDTATMVAANLSFKQRATLAGDQGIQAAYLWLENKQAVSPADLNLTDTPAGYFSARHAADPSWNPANNWDNAVARSLPPDSVGNEISYVIHRMCSNPNMAYGAEPNKCATHSASSGGVGAGASQGSKASAFKDTTYLYYRITVRIVGSRNTVSYVQSLVLVPAT